MIAEQSAAPHPVQKSIHLPITISLPCQARESSRVAL